MLALLLCSFAFAEPGTDTPSSEQLAMASERSTVDGLVAEARRRLVVGDYEGATITAREALAQPGAHQPLATYLMAMSLEYGDKLEEALAIYDRLLAEMADTARTQDLQFRRASTLGKMGQFEAALTQLDALGDVAETPSDNVKLKVLRGLWLLESKGGEEEGLQILRDTLAAAAPIDAPSHQAMALGRLVELAANESRSIVFKGGKRKKSKRLANRASLVSVATDQLVPMIQLNSPRWTLPAFLDVGEAFEAFGDAMLAESKVRGLSKDQRVIYEEERRNQVVGVYVKASRYLDRGAQYAEITRWAGPEADALNVGLKRIQQKVESLDGP